jgi:hypothetical protein
MGETLHRHRVAVTDIGLDGLGERHELRHGRGLERVGAAVLRAGRLTVNSAGQFADRETRSPW